MTILHGNEEIKRIHIKLDDDVKYERNATFLLTIKS